MNKRISQVFALFTVVVILLVVLSSFASAGFFSNLFGKSKANEKPIVETSKKIIGKCVDSDGRNYSVQGNATFSGVNISSKPGLNEYVLDAEGSVVDQCMNKNQLVEFYCLSSVSLAYEKVTCKNGCSDG